MAYIDRSNIYIEIRLVAKGTFRTHQYIWSVNSVFFKLILWTPVTRWATERLLINYITLVFQDLNIDIWWEDHHRSELVRLDKDRTNWCLYLSLPRIFKIVFLNISIKFRPKIDPFSFPILFIRLRSKNAKYWQRISHDQHAISRV